MQKNIVTVSFDIRNYVKQKKPFSVRLNPAKVEVLGEGDFLDSEGNNQNTTERAFFVRDGNQTYAKLGMTMAEWDTLIAVPPVPEQPLPLSTKVSSTNFLRKQSDAKLIEFDSSELLETVQEEYKTLFRLQGGEVLNNIYPNVKIGTLNANTTISAHGRFDRFNTTGGSLNAYHSNNLLFNKQLFSATEFRVRMRVLVNSASIHVNAGFGIVLQQAADPINYNMSVSAQSVVCLYALFGANYTLGVRPGLIFLNKNNITAGGDTSLQHTFGFHESNRLVTQTGDIFEIELFCKRRQDKVLLNWRMRSVSQGWEMPMGTGWFQNNIDSNPGETTSPASAFTMPFYLGIWNNMLDMTLLDYAFDIPAKRPLLHLVGDRVATGFRVNASDTLAAQLEQRTGHYVAASGGGTASVQGLASSALKEVIATRPKYAVFLFQWEIFKQRWLTDSNAYAQDIYVMAKTLHQHGIQPVFVQWPVEMANNQFFGVTASQIQSYNSTWENIRNVLAANVVWGTLPPLLVNAPASLGLPNANDTLGAGFSAAANAALADAIVAQVGADKMNF
jgi:hypothetical protein